MLGSFTLDRNTGIAEGEGRRIQMPRCGRCGHWACPCCENWCDTAECLEKGPCSDGLCAFLDRLEELL